MTGALADLPRFVYGTTRLGDTSVPRSTRVAATTAARDAGLWVHTSDQYGEALDVLGEVVAQTGYRPETIVKLGGGSPAAVRVSALRQIAPLSIPPSRSVS